MITLPVWLNRGAPATSRRPFLDDTTDVTVYPKDEKQADTSTFNNGSKFLKIHNALIFNVSFFL